MGHGRSSPLAVLIVGVCATSALAGQAEGPEAVAEKYWSLWLAGKTCEGISACWDVSRTLARVFQDDYAGLSGSDRLYTQHLFTVFTVASNRLPGVRQSLKGASIERQGTQRDKDRARVSAILHTTTEDRPVWADLVRVGNEWKIVNLGHGPGKDFGAIKPFWEKFRDAGPGRTLAQFWETMVSWMLKRLYPQPKGK